MSRHFGPLIPILGAACTLLLARPLEAQQRQDLAQLPILPPDYLLVSNAEFPVSSQRACDLLRDSTRTASDTVFRHAEVTRPAALLGSQLEIPRRSGEGAVVFVVDTTGRPDAASVRVIWATHVDVARWMQRYVSRMIYAPAERERRTVRQCVVLPLAANVP